MYQIYREIQDVGTFWRNYLLKHGQLPPASQQEEIYSNYVVKCQVFQRDGFKCQNEGCGSTERITFHHMKFQKNKGDHKVRNAVTLCEKCHVKYHNASIALRFGPSSTVSPHLKKNGIYKIYKERAFFTKEDKAHYKKFRHAVINELPETRISWNELIYLIHWLEQPMALGV